MMLHRHFEGEGRPLNMTTLADVTPKAGKAEEQPEAPQRKKRPKKTDE